MKVNNIFQLFFSFLQNQFHQHHHQHDRVAQVLQAREARIGKYSLSPTDECQQEKDMKSEKRKNFTCLISSSNHQIHFLLRQAKDTNIEKNQLVIRVNFNSFFTIFSKHFNHLDSRLSNTDTYLTGSFDPLPTTSSKKKNMHRSSHTWKPQRNNSSSTSHRSRLTPMYRSTSIEPSSIGDYRIRSNRSPTSVQISSKMKNHSPTRYQSSLIISQPHTNRKIPSEKLSSNLYLDPQTGIV